MFVGSYSFAQGVGGGGSDLPVPPPGAIVFSQINQMSGWSSCHDPGCAGGSGQGSYWMAQFQRNPSLSGDSAELFNSGVWANALFFKKLGSHDGVSNLLWDFYVQLDGASGAQSLEFDSFQFVGGYNYMIGSQCDIAVGVWDTWDESRGHWNHTTIPCHKFQAGTWHHIQWYMTTNTSAHTYTYVTLVIDGSGHSINYTGHALYNGWGNNLGVQWQLDDNAAGGGYEEWTDKSTLTVW